MRKKQEFSPGGGDTVGLGGHVGERQNHRHPTLP